MDSWTTTHRKFQATMNLPLTCTDCGHHWDQGPEPVTGCPRCRGTAFHLVLHETVGRQEDEVRYFSKEKRRGKRLIEGFARFSETRSGPLAATRPWVHQ